jgi:methylated-DNA-[protein]-cysteine S-methyltransferase
MKTPTRATHHGTVTSPIGTILILATGDALSGLYVADHHRAPQPRAGSIEGGRAIEKISAQITEYFDGNRTEFDVPLALEGTAFQREVWQALLGVGYGKTASYLDIARAIGKPEAVRAVGMANGSNPVSIVVPCHRVIGSNGSLTGYGWGTERKKWLLDFERTPRLL